MFASFSLLLCACPPVAPGAPATEDAFQAAAQTSPAPRVVQTHLGAQGSSGQWNEVATAVATAGAELSWHPASTSLIAPQDRSLVVFVQQGSSSGRIHGPSTPATPFKAIPAKLGVGDMVLLRPGFALDSEGPLGLLVFARTQPFDAQLPPVIRPDFDPQITDTPGGCATEAGAYRRVCLTWQGKNGPYLDQHLNAHRVRIRDSFTHYHPVDGGFDELYLVQDALPGSELIVCEQLDRLLQPGSVPDEDAASLLRHIPLHSGDLVFLPRGTAHRGLGGVLAQVITLPGFVPGAEIPVDDAIARVNRSASTQLPRHHAGVPFVAVVPLADRVRIEIGDQLFTEYLHQNRPRPSFYPVLSPDGRALTRSFPFETSPGEAQDHPHHVSLWFAHGSVNGQDFWHNPEARMRLLEVRDAYSRPGEGGFTAVHEWIAPDGTAQLRDERRFRIVLSNQGYQLDWDQRLSALDQPVLFGDTKEGTMAVRLAAGLRVEGEVASGSLLTSNGHRDGEAWGKRAGWLLASGQLQQRPASIAILEHPDNFRYPTWWHARKYGLVAANPFGVHDFADAPRHSGNFKLGAGKSLRLRYRFLFSDRALQAAEVDAHAHRFSASR